MTECLVVAQGIVGRDWARALRKSGIETRLERDADCVSDLFTTAAIDIVVLDMSGEGAMTASVIPKVRDAWPECRILVVLSGVGFRSDAVYKLGLWRPDQILVAPVPPALLKATVSLLASQQSANRQEVPQKPNALRERVRKFG